MEEKIKAGLEIHQQLDTNKLFCNCPAILRNDAPSIQVKRKLHAVAGETGEVDVAAKHEAARDKEFAYQGYDTTCLVELDEEPPHLINEEALEIALHVALLLNCEILPITQIMRKTVIDGSNTSGFQRTVLIARNGYIETEQGKIRIENVSLEEDAARIIGKENGQTLYRLDRLGIPLIEIGTAPDIKNPEKCKEVALYIGEILRSCKVKRGIGTIRQDINVSIEYHPRIEIKGFQDVKMFVPTIIKEIERQKQNLTSKNKLVGEVRNALPDGTTEFLRPMPGASRMYPETDLPLLIISRDIINEAKNSLPKLRQDIKEELKRKGLSEDQARLLLKKNLLWEFEAFLKTMNEPRFIYKVLIELPKEIQSKEKKDLDSILTIDILDSIVHLVKKGTIMKENVKHIMEEVAKGKSLDELTSLKQLETSDVETEIAKIIKEKPGLSHAAYMGLVMQKFKGKIPGKDAADILNKLLNKS